MPGYLCVTLLARAHVFQKVGQFDANLPHGNDLEWFLRATKKRMVVELLPEVLVHRRLHGNNRSRRLASNSRDTILQILKASLDSRRAASNEADHADNVSDGEGKSRN